ncbi:26S proteasome non-ATPase regulatory subunit 12 [Phellopilus nigrolimitatus]|nr:26S proteasome non-ATPase regulatory subunit 12 [Phellopilus nigrolimitatus]
MSEQKKQERDFTPEVDVLIPEATALAKEGKLLEVIDKLLALEKQTRNASDQKSTIRLATTISDLAYEARDYTQLNANISLLSKKHGQLKVVVQTLVEKTMGWLEEVKSRDGLDRWLELIETLRQVTEGKIFLETPRARVTLALAHYHESLANQPTPNTPPPQKSLETASELLNDLQVETYSSMERKEKTEFLLEQMRLLVLVARGKDAEDRKEGKDDLSRGEADWIKVRVGGRKVNEGFLKEKGNEELKLKYYDLMIQYALHGSEYLDVAKHYHKIWETPTIKEDVTGKGREALENVVYFIVLAPHNNEQSDMLHRIFQYPELTKLELHRNFMKCFTTQELMRWPGIEGIYGATLRNTKVFGAGEEKRWEDLHTRFIEHNVRVIARYYTRISMKRLTSLLDLSAQQTEETLCRLVVSKTIWARIDRPTGIVNFRDKKTAEDVMNNWSSDMQRLLGLVEKTWMGMNAALAAQSRVKA